MYEPKPDPVEQYGGLMIVMLISSAIITALVGLLFKLI